MVNKYYDLIDKNELYNNILLLFQRRINPYYVLHDNIKNELVKKCIFHLCSGK